MAETGIAGVDDSLFDGLSVQQRAYVLSQIGEGKSVGVAVVLCFLLGGFGAHYFYLKYWGNAIVCLLLCWTFIPALACLITIWFVPKQTRAFNRKAISEAVIRARLLGT